jgi:hypothetical protein
LQKFQIKPYRPLKEDMELTVNVSSYSGGSASAKPQAAVISKPASSNRPDFKSMTSAQKVAYARQKIKAELSR